jgi:hypothetical protein
MHFVLRISQTYNIKPNAKTSGKKVLDMNSIDPDTMWLDIVVLIALNIAFRLVGA